jgi:adenylyltransferase/sulfurtransferase
MTFAIIGAGGLGGPIAYALAAGGARSITICDPDVVELSNLQRQIQFTTADIGRAKAPVLAAELVRRGFPGERIRAVTARLCAANASTILDGADVAIDASDNLATKFCVNDAACAAGIRFVIAAVTRATGQVLAVVPGVTGCYRCLFEEPPEGDNLDDDASCSRAGVFGAAVAIIAGVAARTALALAAGTAPGGELCVFDDLTADLEPRRVRYNSRRGCPACMDAQFQVHRPVPTRPEMPENVRE